MFFERIISFILSLFLFISCSFSSAEYIIPVTIEGALFGGKNDDSISTEIEFDTSWVTEKNNTVYNSKLASFSAILCTDVYFRSKDVSKGTQNRVLVNGKEDLYTQSLLLEELGYSDVKFIETYKAKQYDSDNNDSATILLGYKNVDNKYDSFIVAIRGCFSIGERISIFDIGSDGTEYTSLTGSHSEWTDKSYFKGLYIASQRAKEFIDEYIMEHDNSALQNTMLLTGASRGANIANIIGSEFEDDSSIKSYTYTFNTMPVTKSENAGNYKTIFNTIDVNDYYTNPLPFGKEEFRRYGRDIEVDILNNKKIKAELSKLKGRDDYFCLDPEVRKEYISLFSESFPDRKSLYISDTFYEKYDTEAQAKSRISVLNVYISSLSIGDYFKVKDDPELINGKYCVVKTYCPESFIICMAQIQAYGQQAYDAVAGMFTENVSYSRIAAILNDNFNQINSGHLIANGYETSKIIKFR